MIKIVPIFDKGSLYSISFNNEKDECEKLFDFWGDTEAVYVYLVKREAFLKAEFFQHDTLVEVYNQILYERKLLHKALLNIDKLKGPSRGAAIKDFFKPLENTLLHDIRKKAKASSFKPVLRLYAIGLGDKVIITGGGIKLTPTMNEDDELLKELNKMNRIKQFLVENGVVDQEGLTDLIHDYGD